MFLKMCSRITLSSMGASILPLSKYRASWVWIVVSCLASRLACPTRTDNLDSAHDASSSRSGPSNLWQMRHKDFCARQSIIVIVVVDTQDGGRATEQLILIACRQQLGIDASLLHMVAWLSGTASVFINEVNLRRAPPRFVSRHSAFYPQRAKCDHAARLARG